MGSGMADWFLWDGRERQGPMDQSALEARIRAEPNTDLLRVWREQAPKRVLKAYDEAQARKPRIKVG